MEKRPEAEQISAMVSSMLTICTMFLLPLSQVPRMLLPSMATAYPSDSLATDCVQPTNPFSNFPGFRAEKTRLKAS
jgi:hypothetical protein